MKKFLSCLVTLMLLVQVFACVSLAGETTRQVLKVDYVLDRVSDPRRKDFTYAFYCNLADGSSYRYQDGDRLVYDLKTDKAVPGLGVVTLHFGPKGNMLTDTYKDTAFLAANSVGQWSTVSFAIPASLGAETLSAGMLIHLPLTAGDDTPDSFSACFDHIRIERADGKVACTLFDSSDSEAVSRIASVDTVTPWGERPWVKVTVSAFTCPVEKAVAPAERTVINVAYTLDRNADPSRTEFVYAFWLRDLMDTSGYRFRSGDRLVYDMKVSDDVTGLGGIALHFDPKGNMTSDCFDMQKFRLNDNVNRWQAASFTIPDTLGAEKLGGGACIFLNVLADNRTPDSFSVSFDNVRIERADGSTATTIFTSSDAGAVTKIGNIDKGCIWGDRPYIGVRVTPEVCEAKKEETAAKRTVLKVSYTLDRDDDPSRTEFVYAFWLRDLIDTSSYRYKSGDRLVYDMKVSADVTGLGGIALHFDPKGNMLSDCYDLQKFRLADNVNKWQTASFTIPDTLEAEKLGGGACVFLNVLADGDTPDSFSVSFDNIRIERADGTVAATIFSSSDTGAVMKIASVDKGCIWGDRPYIRVSVTPELCDAKSSAKNSKKTAMKVTYTLDRTADPERTEFVYGFWMNGLCDNSSYRYAEGDRLVYKLKVSDSVKGLGLAALHFDPKGNMSSDLYPPEEFLCPGSAGEWRNIIMELPASLEAEKLGGGLCLLLSVTADDSTPDTLTAWFDDIYIIRKDGTIAAKFYSSSDTGSVIRMRSVDTASIWGDERPWIGVTVSGEDCVIKTVDPSPVTGDHTFVLSAVLLALAGAAAVYAGKKRK